MRTRSGLHAQSADGTAHGQQPAVVYGARFAHVFSKKETTHQVDGLHQAADAKRRVQETRYGVDLVFLHIGLHFL